MTCKSLTSDFKGIVVTLEKDGNITMESFHSRVFLVEFGSVGYRNRNKVTSQVFVQI